MKYKGHDIEETRNVMRYEKVDKFTYRYSNEIELGIEVLDELKDLIRKKETELKEKGVRFSDVKIEMRGVDELYNPNGADYEAEFTTELSWIEEETEEEKEKRIQREKELIDKYCEDEIDRKAREERNRRASLEAAIKVIKENGGTVKNLKI
jgi:hypothetical protein